MTMQSTNVQEDGGVRAGDSGCESHDSSVRS